MARQKKRKQEWDGGKEEEDKEGKKEPGITFWICSSRKKILATPLPKKSCSYTLKKLQLRGTVPPVSLLLLCPWTPLGDRSLICPCY